MAGETREQSNQRDPIMKEPRFIAWSRAGALGKGTHRGSDSTGPSAYGPQVHHGPTDSLRPFSWSNIISDRPLDVKVNPSIEPSPVERRGGKDMVEPPCLRHLQRQDLGTDDVRITATTQNRNRTERLKDMHDDLVTRDFAAKGAPAQELAFARVKARQRTMD